MALIRSALQHSSLNIGSPALDMLWLSFEALCSTQVSTLEARRWICYGSHSKRSAALKSQHWKPGVGYVMALIRSALQHSSLNIGSPALDMLWLSFEALC